MYWFLYSSFSQATWHAAKKGPLGATGLPSWMVGSGNNCSQMTFPLPQGWIVLHFQGNYSWLSFSGENVSLSDAELHDPNLREHEINAQPGWEDVLFYLHQEKGDWTRKEESNTKSVYEISGLNRTQYLKEILFLFLYKISSNSLIRLYFRLLTHQL